jgi:hypothetical protein
MVNCILLQLELLAVVERSGKDAAAAIQPHLVASGTGELRMLLPS